MTTSDRVRPTPEVHGPTTGPVALAGPLAHDLLTVRARVTPDAPAVTVGRTIYSYAHLDQASDNLGHSLASSGVARGDRVAVVAENSVELVAGLWAGFRAGAVVVVVNPGVKADKLAYILNDAGATTVITQSHLAPTVLSAVAETPTTSTVIWSGGVPAAAGSTPAAALDHRDLGAEVQRPGRGPKCQRVIDADVAALMYTAGPNGRPKGVMLTHRTLVGDAVSSAEQLGLRPEDTIHSLRPMALGYGPYLALMAAHAGAALTVQPTGHHQASALTRVARTNATVLTGDPGSFIGLLRDGPADHLDLGHVRLVVNLATPVPAAATEQLAKTFPGAAFHSLYGVPECPRLAYRTPELAERKPAAIGRPVGNIDVHVIDSDGRRAGPGVVGELVVRGSGTMLGYWQHPEETEAGLRRGPWEGAAVLHTGDQCWQDEEGDLYLAGRSDDTFLCRGERVSPREIEAVLLELDQVVDAAVVGVPHELDGMAGLAMVVLDADHGHELAETTILDHCRQRLEDHLIPLEVRRRISLPRTANGRIRRDALALVSDHPALGRADR